MKKPLLALIALAVVSIYGCSNDKKNDDTHQTAAVPADTTAAVTTSEEKKEPAAEMDSAAMAKAWESYMTPGEMHKWMASTDGKWDAEFTFWEGPEAPPQKGARAKAEFKTILGGKYQESVYRGDMFGMPFEGRGVTGFDNAKKKFLSTWIDNMGTGMMFMEGTWDESTRSITSTGKGVDPVSGKEVEMREVLKIVDDKHQVMEMYDNKTGKEYKSMEIRLTKK